QRRSARGSREAGRDPSHRGSARQEPSSERSRRCCSLQTLGAFHRARALRSANGSRQRREARAILLVAFRQEGPLRGVMKGFIVLLRHGIAEDKSEDKPDAERRLTETGKRRMKKIA